MSALMLRRRAMKAPATGPLVSDSFDRADSTTTMGNADTGQAWVPNSGTWGIQTNQAYEAATANQSTTVVEAGISDCTVKATMPTNGDAGPCFRSVDNDNHFLWSNVTNGTLFKRVAGTYTSLGTGSTAGNHGDVIEFVLSGASIVAKRNGTSVLSVTDAAHQTATKHGLRSNAAAARFDDFSVTA